MTNEATEGLFRRWARRKQAAKAAPDHAAAPAALPEQPAVQLSLPLLQGPVVPEPVLPAPVLPDLETLGPESDYKAFLQNGVAAEVQRIALQRAWASDEQIAGFRGMADYDWDFNAPTYGKLWASDDVARLLQAVVAPPAEIEPDRAEPDFPQDPDKPTLALPGVPQHSQAPAAEPGLATVAEAEAPRAAAPRHGSAMPS